MNKKKEDILVRYDKDLFSQQKRIRELEEAIIACRDCNDNGEPYTSPTADSAQCLSNLFSMVDENNNS